MNEAGNDAAGRLEGIRARIAQAQQRFGPPPSRVKFVAVSKTFPAEAIEPLLAAGQRVFGENRVQEARDKWPALRQGFPEVELHLIGPLQTNKVRDAVALFDVIETVDRERLAAALAAEMERQGRHLRVFVEVNIGAEPQKAGLSPDQVGAFVRRCVEVHGLDVRGLMCIPPEGEPPGPYFAHLATLAREAGVAELSMGMSADFETAIRFGATSVRVGSALFGAR
jgi:hypothetical protein